MALRREPSFPFLISIQHRREFDVVSLSPETATRSQLYLTRYRFRRELENIIKVNKPADGSDVLDAIPLAHRTVDWFISQHIRHFLSGEATDTVKANLRSFFAAHCKWMIKDQDGVMHKHRRLIDVDTWREWYRRWQNNTLPESDESMSADVRSEADAEEADDDMDVDDVPLSPIRRGVKRVVASGVCSPWSVIPKLMLFAESLSQTSSGHFRLIKRRIATGTLTAITTSRARSRRRIVIWLGISRPIRLRSSTAATCNRATVLPPPVPRRGR